MQSYREWYLHVLNDENGKLFFKIVGPEPRMKNIEQYEDPIHVIEKSAFDALQAELDKCAEIVTCIRCSEKTICPYAYDGYNTNGDCLAEK